MGLEGDSLYLYYFESLIVRYQGVSRATLRVDPNAAQQRIDPEGH